MEGENLQGLVEFSARSLIDDPSEVKVNKYQRGSTIQLELNVSKEDMGRVIGKGGRVANSIRVLLRVAAAREGKRATLDIVEP